MQSNRHLGTIKLASVSVVNRGPWRYCARWSGSVVGDTWSVSTLAPR